MKIAIVTWHAWRNYGTVLQATALNQLLNRMGYDCETIRYTPDYSRKPLLTAAVDYVRRRHTSETSKDRREKQLLPAEKETAFDSFREENIRFNKEKSFLGTIFSLKQYDAVIYGSDQIWMPWFFRDEMFGKWVPPGKRIAYAVSMGDVMQLEETPEKTRNKIIRYIRNCSVLSFREDRTSDYLLEKYGIESQCVIDPTLLIEKSMWKNMEREVPTKPEKYLLAYFLDDSNRRKKIEYIYQIAQKMDLRVVFAASTEEDLTAVAESDLFANLGPGEFLNCVHHAELVITDSFHGMVFSTIYDVPFVPLERRIGTGPVGQNERLYSFLKLLGMEKHMSQLKMEDDIANLNLINRNQIHSRINQESEKGIQFLIDAIRKASAK